MQTLKGKNLKKKGAMVVAGAIGATLLLGGAFAWRDFNQHKTNVFRGGSNFNNVTLNDQYKPITEWSAGQIANKKISVTNLDDSTTPVFVRLTLSEYMQTYTQDGGQSGTEFISRGGKKLLFVTEPNGEFLTGTERNGIVKGIDITKYEAINLEAMFPKSAIKGTYYLTNSDVEENGIFGKPMLIPGEARRTWGTGDAARLLDVTDHTAWDENNAVKDLTPYPWYDNGQPSKGVIGTYMENGQSTAVEGTEIRNYIEFLKTKEGTTDLAALLGNNVITTDQWKTLYDDAVKNNNVDEQGFPEINKWVIDDESQIPSVFWGTALLKGTTTDNLMDSVKLLKTPLRDSGTNATLQGKFDDEATFSYFLHAHLGAINTDLETVNQNSQSVELKNFVPEYYEDGVFTPNIETSRGDFFSYINDYIKEYNSNTSNK